MNRMAAEAVSKSRTEPDNAAVAEDQQSAIANESAVAGLEGVPCLPPYPSRVVLSAGAGPAGAESFRFLAHRLQLIRQKRPLCSLLVTSASPKEGKTIVATNLALTLLQTRRTLLIDCDLRSPSVHRLFGIDSRPGVAEYLAGTHGLDSVLCRLEPFGLAFLSAGSCQGDPVELLRESKVRQLLETLRSSFDWIILDSPPVNLVAESAYLSSLCDGTVLVVRSGVTRRQDFEQATTTLEGSFLAGVLMNASDEANERGYHYYASERGEGARG
jgi:capsular exopolysaccharide synthesis family protein